MDLRKPGEEEDEYSEMAEEAMDPDNCFPESKQRAGGCGGGHKNIKTEKHKNTGAKLLFGCRFSSFTS